MNERIIESLNAIADAAGVIKEEILLQEETKQETERVWKNSLEQMIADNKTDTREVFEKYGGFIDRKKEEDMRFCSRRCLESLEGYFEEPYEPKLLDDAMAHLDRFLKLYRR